MKRRTLLGIVVIGACIALTIGGLYGIPGWIITRYWGKEVLATVTAIPRQCDKYNSIKVILDRTTYEVSISRQDCWKNVYKVGQRVTLLKHDRYEDPVWPESRPDLFIACLLVAGVLVYISIRAQLKK